MELFLILFFVVIFAAITYKMAEGRGRNAWGYTIVGILISPVIMWVLLAILGKTQEKKVQEHLEFKKAIADAEPIFGQ